MRAEAGGVRVSLNVEDREVEISFGWHEANISHREAKILGTALIEMAKEAENESQA